MILTQELLKQLVFENREYVVPGLYTIQLSKNRYIIIPDNDEIGKTKICDTIWDAVEWANTFHLKKGILKANKKAEKKEKAEVEKKDKKEVKK